MEIENQLNEKLDNLKKELESLTEPWQLLLNEYLALRMSNSSETQAKYNELLALQFKMKQLKDFIDSLENMISPVLESGKMDYTKEAVETMQKLFEAPLNQVAGEDQTMGGR